MSKFAILPYLIPRARRSTFWLFVLNKILARTIPFNKPHKFRILSIAENSIETFAPYRRSNHNHIRGVHACAIATVAEFSAGFLLLTKLDPTQYRLIMAKLDADYFYQAKKDIIAQAELSEQDFHEKIVVPLSHEDSTTIVMTTFIRDISGNNVAQVKTTWQVKNWDTVRTKV
jgi:acyl-coenzyme A thioesterase PaaI-like protein